MLEPTPTTTYLKDYTPPPFLISTVALDVDIRDDHTQVAAKLGVSRNPQASDPAAPLVLNGEDLELISIVVDAAQLGQSEYSLSGNELVVAAVPDVFTLETLVRIKPQDNTKLMGLYASKDGYFTQCEAEGFRRITFFIDRPDVMARYTCTIHAERARFPTLLSNGNLHSQGDEAHGRHWARWQDPFPKPSYLFAMVAAKLDKLEDSYETMSGRTARLFVYVEPGKIDQCHFAMQALKRAMQWDEQVFGLELDLEQYMIVAVGDFNMGAMENKGLNIFNTKFVLARADTATDTDFMYLDRVVAHEYFHNWTGNRVTCRDWFQLSLKEGLTVFRDQEYGADVYSRPVQRIQEVRSLRASQFPEDAGPMAHPVRPQSYMEINNFYTATVYDKGAEVVRMIHTLLGARGFREGMDLYFERHDGKAVCTEDFVQAMQDASGFDLSQFRRWYDQAGTPLVDARGEYDPARRRYTLTLRQSCPPTPGQSEKLPFHIPVTVALVGVDGSALALQNEGESEAAGTARVLQFTQNEEHYVFVNVPEQPVPSLLRGFSAPVVLNFDYDTAALAHLMAHDDDPFNRWEAAQRLSMQILLKGIEKFRSGGDVSFPDEFVDAIGRVLAGAETDPAFAAEVMRLPAAEYIAEQMKEVDPDAIDAVRTALRRHIAARLQADLSNAYDTFITTGPYTPDAQAAGRRALRNLCLGYLIELEADEILQKCVDQFERADNMTDAMAALAMLASTGSPARARCLDAFYERWQHEQLVIDKWFAVQSTSRLPGVLDAVRRLLQHPAFDLKNPNKVRAVVGAFCHANHLHFHAGDGSGYAFAADQVIALDPINPQVAARLARAFDRWRRFDRARQSAAQLALERVRDTSGLSADTFEIVTRLLDAPAA